MHVLLAILALLSCAPLAAAQAKNGAVNKLETEVLRASKKSHQWTSERAEAVEALCADGVELVAEDPGLWERWEAALFAVAGTVLSKDERCEDGSPESRVVDAAVGALRASIGRARQVELAEAVLPSSSTPAGTRRAIAKLFLHNPPPAAMLSLSLAARDSDRRLAVLSLEALAGWNDDLVHAVFVEEIARVLGPGLSDDERAERMALVERHLSQVEVPAHSNASRHLRELALDNLRGTDAERAALATAWTRAMSHEAALDTLAAALEAWRERAAAMPAIEDPRISIAWEMETRFGVALGLDPEPWRLWWSDVRAGRRAPPPEREKRGTAVGSFFGIKTKSKRVVFVLDRSGSMSSPYFEHGGLGTGGAPVQPQPGKPLGSGTGKGGGGRVPSVQRWDEAKNQLFQFLAKSPPDMLFDVVLFHDGAEAFRGKPVPVNGRQIAELRQWLSRHGPGGGTHLKAGVELALGQPILAAPRAPKGPPGPHTQAPEVVACRQEMVLLCDGGTAEGPGWVADFVRYVAKPKGLVLHAVQVGGDSDGALEGLAGMSGGEFVKVGL